MSFSRTLTFKSDATIVSPLTIMLTFDKVNAVPELQQVAWKVLNFGGPNQFATVTYQQSLMFASVQVNEGQVVTAEAYTPIEINQKTSLIKSGAGVKFTPPTAGNTGQLIATNSTGNIQGLAIGFLDNSNVPNPLLVWPTVGNTNSVEAIYTPVLTAYATSDYQQNQLITGEIVSPVLLKQDLALLPPSQHYTILMNPDGSYAIIPSSTKDDPNGNANHISVRNNLPIHIQVSVGNTTNGGGSEKFFSILPNSTENWERFGPEVVFVNTGGAERRVTTFYGVPGKTLQINTA